MNLSKSGISRRPCGPFVNAGSLCRVTGFRRFVVGLHEEQPFKIGDRHRKDPGDISALAGSIQEVGLLHPVGVTRIGDLIFGWRRLEAYKQLGRKTIPVRILDLDQVSPFSHRL